MRTSRRRLTARCLTASLELNCGNDLAGVQRMGEIVRKTFVGGQYRCSSRWLIPVLAFLALVAPATARAQAVLTETENASALKFADAEGTVGSLEAKHSSSALAAAEEISGETQPSTSELASGLGPNAQAMASTPVDVVVLHGHFVEGNFPHAAGIANPRRHRARVGDEPAHRRSRGLTPR